MGAFQEKNGSTIPKIHISHSEYQVGGLTIGDLYATAALHGIISSGSYTSVGDAATHAFDIAEAMLVERSKRIGKDVLEKLTDPDKENKEA